MLMKSPPQSEGDLKKDLIEADVCILGAGPGGVTLAIALSAYGQSVVLVEKHKMGGTSLNYGAVPAAVLQAAAARAQAFRTAAGFGIQSYEPVVDRSALAASIAEGIAAEAPNASAERLTGLGVQVIHGVGRFADTRTVVAGPHRIVARRFVIATGSAAVVPQIDGLAAVPTLTSETIYANREPIDHLIVVGGGATGVEIAQAQRRLGARVTVVEKDTLLKRYDPELSAVVCGRLQGEGVVLVEGACATAVSGQAGRLSLDVAAGGQVSRIEGSHLLIACGRRPVVTDLGLKEAKVAFSDGGIKVNSWLRTTNRSVFALGDAIGEPFSTNRAQYHASLLQRTLLFRQSPKVQPELIPSVLHTDPELATVGLGEAEALARKMPIQVLRWPVRENVRAITSRATEGHIKVIAERGGRILGAGIAAPLAGELIQVWALALQRGMTVEDMSGWIAPYPSLGELARNAGINRSSVASAHAVSRRWVKLLAKLG